MLNVMTEAQYQAAMLKRIEEQKGKEDAQIKNYIKTKGYEARKLPSGMYIVTTKPGTGANPTVGQNVQVHYTGTLLNGQKFDSSVDRGAPFSFPLGQGRVIKGWDEGIADLKMGEKAILLIPSYMGYGMQGSPPKIPGNAILVFEVELLGAN
jgi:FKBP-type peptidyl-prolyl cis-trans isomerase